MTTAIDMIIRCREHQLNGGEAPPEFYREMALQREETVQGLSTYLPPEEVIRDYIPEGQSPFEIADREIGLPDTAPTSVTMEEASGWA